MALMKDIGGSRWNLYRPILQKTAIVDDGALTSLIVGESGKRINIWRLFITCAAGSKNCQILSGGNLLTVLFTQAQELKSSDGIPIFSLNLGDDFKAAPSDETAWHFYIVYSKD